MKKIIRPEGPAKKITLLRYCPKKKSGPDLNPRPPPPPEYQMDVPYAPHFLLMIAEVINRNLLDFHFNLSGIDCKVTSSNSNDSVVFQSLTIF